MVTVTALMGCTSHQSSPPTPRKRTSRTRLQKRGVSAKEFAKAGVAPGHGQKHPAGK
jgi:hypothetical protein